jgi:hypothetical protein
MSFTALITLIIVALLIVFSGLGVVGYNTIYLPRQKGEQQTATVAAQQTSDAQAAATAFAKEVTQQANGDAQANAQATAAAKSDLNAYKQATSGTPVLNDPLQDDSLNNWDTSDSCTFQNNAYVISSNQQKVFSSCLNHSASFDNFTFQVHMKITAGDGGGMILRSDENLTHFYYLEIGVGGDYDLLYYPDTSGKNIKSLFFGDTSTAFNTGYNQDNLITISMHVDTFSIYVNKHLEKVTHDSNLTSGLIGLTALDDSIATNVQYTGAEVWNN